MAHAHFMRITYAANTNSEFAILLAFPRQQYLRERVPMSRFTYIACLPVSITADIKHAAMTK